MLEILPEVLDNIISIRIDGRVTDDDVKRVYDLIAAKLDRHDMLRVDVEIEVLDGISFDALARDIRLGLKNIRNFDKEAIVSDKRWLQTMAKVRDKMFPSVDVRHFSWEEQSDALEWIRT